MISRRELGITGIKTIADLLFVVYTRTFYLHTIIYKFASLMASPQTFYKFLFVVNETYNFFSVDWKLLSSYVAVTILERSYCETYFGGFICSSRFNRDIFYGIFW